MYRTYRSLLTVLLAGLLGGLAMAQEKTLPPPGTASTVPNDDVAATVNGEKIPEIAVLRALKTVPPDKHHEARAEIVNFLVDNALIEQHLVAQAVTVDQKEVDTRLAEMKAQLDKEKLTYDKVLHDMMLTEQELRSHVMAEIRWQKFVDGQANEKTLRELFDRSPDMFDGSMVHARHILLSPPSGDAKAVEQARQQLTAIKKQVEDQVAAGMAKLPANSDNLAKEKERGRLMEDAFATIAKEKSACPSNKQGGDVGWFPRSGSMVEPFAKAAFALKPYQMSDVVTTQFGLHLILAVDRKPGKTDVKFEDAKDDVKDVFAGRLRENLCEQLRAKAKIVTK
jgi:parvulin-like peptidyl-prolyl isomerase